VVARAPEAITAAAGTEFTSAVPPLPNRPFAPAPQHFTAPPVKITHVWALPQATEMTPEAMGVTGVLALVVLPIPS
jgi:hypothetical protein